MKKIDVLGLGIATQDILALTPRLPQSNDCFPIPALDMQGGGPVATALVTLSRLGARCAYLGPFAPDPTGKQIMAELRQYGIDIIQLSNAYRRRIICFCYFGRTGKRDALHFVSEKQCRRVGTG